MVSGLRARGGFEVRYRMEAESSDPLPYTFFARTERDAEIRHGRACM
ncbi:hypothetical protein [Paenibacillus sp. MER TA 81-3]